MRQACRFGGDRLASSLRLLLVLVVGADGARGLGVECLFCWSGGIPVIPSVSVFEALLASQQVCLFQFFECPLNRACAYLHLELP